MVLSRILEGVGIKPRIDVTKFIPFDQAGNGWKMKLYAKYNYELNPDLYSAASHLQFIHEAVQQGIIPLSLVDIMSGISTSPTEYVLFDSLPSVIQPGNHWIVNGINHDKQSASLSFSGSFGIPTHDDSIEAFELSLHAPFFTGVTTQKYTLNGRELTLRETNAYYNGDPNAYGTLIIPGEHRTFFSEGARRYLQHERFGYISPQPKQQ